ncbi:MAG: [acyl-carrier-protein] S-malonyltransferase [Clostridia bacterium]|nr:[acyl-carrier-protein] S-malonyltransferase [Erysipelotrichia bacterium]NCC87586.1 [acyl-carrier-protein] S-malonyltransferase [Clostridia bacterium]
MKIGFLFAGQGAQYVGMGKAFYEHYPQAKKVYDEIKIDFDIKDVCFEGPKTMLDDTAYAQSCIFATSMAIAEVIKAHGIVADYVAGLSLGEYSALCYAQAMRIQEGVEIVRERGKIMANALPKGTSAMAAILQCEESMIQEVCKEVATLGVCEIANYNCPGQIVISGDVKAIEKASELLLVKGAKRVIPLNVSGAFHCSLLEEASTKLHTVLQKYDLHTPRIPVIYNTSGKEESKPVIDILTKQIKSSVYFMQSIQYMIAQGVEAFVEIGPGATLSGFVRKCDRSIPVYSVDSIDALEKMLGALYDKNGK